MRTPALEREAGVSLGRGQLFFDVIGRKALIFCRTLTEAHLGHFTRFFSCSDIPIVSVKFFPQASHL
jgi:hypothetical protein